MLRVSELNKSVKERAYQESLVENMKCGEVEREWEKFRDIVM